MSGERRLTVMDVPSQRAIVAATDSKDKYDALFDKHFINGFWPDYMASELAHHDTFTTSPDYFRLMGLTAIVSAQYGFPQLDGQVHRHRHKGWEKSVAHPRHQLALASYVGDLNEQVHPLKENLIKKTGEVFTQIGEPKELALGIWGIMYQPQNGEIIDPHFLPEDVLAIASSRITQPSGRPVCLPDRELNRQLADLAFTGDDADNMSQRAFEEEILPKVIDLADGMFDPIPVFTESPPPDHKKIIYSYVK